MSVIPFDEIVTGAAVRLTVINKIQYISIRDLIMITCVKNNNEACEVWRRLPLDLKKELLDGKMLEKFQFIGRGNKKQPVITFQGAIKLMMCLPGSNARSVRSATAHILARYCEGDKCLHNEISKNKQIGTAKACISLLTSSLKKRKHQQENSIPISGWIYGTHSNAFPKMIKIGKAKYLKQRISSGNTFCAPAKHSVVAAVPSFNPGRDEKMVHEHFTKQRCVGEFFKVSQTEVQSFFDDHIMPQYQKDLVDIVAKFRSPQ
jgi:hypothetical protein